MRAETYSNTSTKIHECNLYIHAYVHKLYILYIIFKMIYLYKLYKLNNM